MRREEDDFTAWRSQKENQASPFPYVYPDMPPRFRPDVVPPGMGKPPDADCRTASGGRCDTVPGDQDADGRPGGPCRRTDAPGASAAVFPDQMAAAHTQVVLALPLLPPEN